MIHVESECVELTVMKLLGEAGRFSSSKVRVYVLGTCVCIGYVLCIRYVCMYWVCVMY